MLVPNLAQRWRGYVPPILASLILLVTVGQALSSSLALNDGQFVYALDDAYIHMSIAENFARHGVWGITEYGFSSTTSSPLWTLLIALTYIVTGPVDLIPYLYNVLLAVGILFAADRLMRTCDLKAAYRLAALVALIVLVPLNTLIMIGMEHVLQILVVLLFMDQATALLLRDDDAIERRPVLRGAVLRVVALGVLVGTVRYEGLFLVLIYCILLAARRRILLAVVLGVVSITPVIVYGLIAINAGWEFLPASLIVKSGSAAFLQDADWSGRFRYLVVDTYNIMANQHVLSLAMLAALGVYLFRYDRARALWERGLILLIAFVGITLVNVRLVSWPDPGTYSRYEAYLVALALVVIPAGLGGYLPRAFQVRAIPVYGVALILCAFLIQDFYRRYEVLAFQEPVVTGSNDIYLQQYQMGHFLDTYYDDATVAANDIGAINYYADLRLIDLWGLGSIEVARARQENRYDTGAIATITAAEGVEIALIYRPWFDLFGGLPESWVLVGEWRVERSPVILGYDVVSFYAVDPDAVDTLQDRFETFSATLPAGIEVMPVEIARSDDNDDDDYDEQP